MKTLLAVINALSVLVACGDNMSPSAIRDLPLSHSQTMESQNVVDGTYTLNITGDVVSWELSPHGVVYVPVRSAPRGTVISAIKIRMAFKPLTDPPDVHLIDQVDDAMVELPATLDATLPWTPKYTLNQELLLGSDGEILVAKVIAGQTPVKLYALTTFEDTDFHFSPSN